MTPTLEARLAEVLPCKFHVPCPEYDGKLCSICALRPAILTLLCEERERGFQKGFQDGMHLQYEHTLRGERGLYDGSEPSTAAIRNLGDRE